MLNTHFKISTRFTIIFKCVTILEYSPSAHAENYLSNIAEIVQLLSESFAEKKGLKFYQELKHLKFRWYFAQNAEYDIFISTF